MSSNDVNGSFTLKPFRIASSEGALMTPAIFGCSTICAGGGFSQFNESFEVMFCVVRAGGGFGMILNGNNWQRFVTHSFDAFVIEIYVSHFDFRRQTIGLHGKAVIM